MGLTIAQAKQSVQSKDPLLAGVMQTFVDNAPILEYLPFSNQIGQTISWVRELALPTSAFRAIDESYGFTGVNGTTERKTEDLKILGTKCNVDRAVVKMLGTEPIQTQHRMQIKSVARTFSENFFIGDGTNNSFTGLEARIASGQKIAMADDGAAFTLEALDEALIKCKGTGKIIWVPQETFLSMQKLARGKSNVNYLPDNFGQWILTYNGYPVRVPGEKVDEAQILTFSETQGNSSVTASVYVTAINEDGVKGVQTSPIEIITSLTNTVAGAYEVEWLTNWLLSTKYSAIRVHGITDVAVTD